MIVDSTFGGGWSESTTYRRHMLDRLLIFERVIGIHIRAQEHEQRRREAQLSSDYDRSVRQLMARQKE